MPNWLVKKQKNYRSMNGWTLQKVFRVNDKMVVARDIEDAIALYRQYASPNNVTIEKVEMIFGPTRIDCDAICREIDDRETVEVIAKCKERNAQLIEAIRTIFQAVQTISLTEYFTKQIWKRLDCCHNVDAETIHTAFISQRLVDRHHIYYTNQKPACEFDTEEANVLRYLKPFEEVWSDYKQWLYERKVKTL